MTTFLTFLQKSEKSKKKYFQVFLMGSVRMQIVQSEKSYWTFPANGSYLQTAEPYKPCTVLVFQGSDDGLTPHRRLRARRSPPHLGKGTTWCLSSRQRCLVWRKLRKAWSDGGCARLAPEEAGASHWPCRRSIIMGRSSSLLLFLCKVSLRATRGTNMATVWVSLVMT